MKTIVISLGGSLIVPDKIDIPFLRKFREIINKHKTKYKFIIVTGGGSTARKYINALSELTNLVILNLEHNSISDINPLSGFTPVTPPSPNKRSSEFNAEVKSKSSSPILTACTTASK